ncbi:bifunctional nicotinamidase/pyrazinamidase [Persicobacter diffluens]|uniref:Nicotinamidase n=1 Tax=Persicobacter diffluens TaxID=981 RepID=A0AAN4W373_9BACT|nr:nicotinamidase/pyrazinamidase [Persicobacter diffluens]
MRALLIVDLQYDFLEGGALAVPKANEIIPVVRDLMSKGLPIFATQDFHPAGHKSFASQHEGRQIGEMITMNGMPQVLWPDHCVQGTHGAAFFEDLEIAKRAIVVQKGKDVEVDSYSGFFDNGRRHQTELDEFLKIKNIQELIVLGLATDYCVKFTVLDALSLGYQVRVVTDGVRAVNLNAGDGERALAEMATAGADISISSEIKI